MIVGRSPSGETPDRAVEQPAADRDAEPTAPRQAVVALWIVQPAKRLHQVPFRGGCRRGAGRLARLGVGG